MEYTPSPSAAPRRRSKYPLARTGRSSVRWGELLRRWDRITLQVSSQRSVRVASDSASIWASVGVGALAAAPPPLGGVGALADCSGERTLPLGLGVATGVDAVWELKTLIGMGVAGGSRDKSVVVLMAKMVSSKVTALDSLYWSIKFDHAERMLASEQSSNSGVDKSYSRFPPGRQCPCMRA